jgi:hypothetical protein
MAWERLSRDSAEFTGDAPADAFAAALDGVARAYLERFSRRPTAREVRSAFDAVLRATPARWVEDPDQLAPDAAAPGRWLDADAFEAAAGDVQGDVTPAVIIRRATRKVALRFKVTVRDRVLHAPYEINDPELTPDDAWRLFVIAFLRRYANGTFAADVDTVSLGPVGGDRIVRPYPRG